MSPRWNSSSLPSFLTNLLICSLQLKAMATSHTAESSYMIDTGVLKIQLLRNHTDTTDVWVTTATKKQHFISSTIPPEITNSNSRGRIKLNDWFLYEWKTSHVSDINRSSGVRCVYAPPFKKMHNIFGVWFLSDTRVRTFPYFCKVG